MQVQRTQNNNPKINFGAKLTIKDSGNCLTRVQKRMLIRLSDLIGADSDRVFCGTRRYKTKFIDDSGEEHIGKKKDALILALVGNLEKHIIIPNKLIQKILKEENTNFSPSNDNTNTILYEFIVKNLNALSELGKDAGSAKISKNKIKEMKVFLKEFCSLKHTYHKDSFLQNVFIRKPNKPVKQIITPSVSKSEKEQSLREYLWEMFGFFLNFGPPT